MVSAVLLSLVLSLLPLSTYAGMYGQPVVNVDAKTFKAAMAVEHAAMVAFVAPWCGHCKNLGPEYTAAAQSLSPLIPFYAIDCDASVNKPLCAEHQIKGFPTIKAFPRAGKGAARDYNGERKKGALVEYAKGLVPDRVKKLRADDGAEKVVQAFLNEKPELPHALLTHPSTPSIPFLWKVLGHRLSGKMHLAFIRDTSKYAVLSSLGIYDPKDASRDATRAVVWRAGERDRSANIEYEGGAMKFNALLDWLQTEMSSPSSAPKRRKSVEVPEQDVEERTEQPNPSRVEDAPDAIPAEGLMDDHEVVGESARSESGAAPPEPEAESVDPVGEEAAETGRPHEEL